MSPEEGKIVSTGKSRIQSSATDDVERCSPFFIKNELICKRFGKLITELGGESIGNYNAWSYKVKGKLVRKHQWIFQIEKATYTGGNLFISSEKQNLHVASRWICTDFKSSLPDFKIRGRRTGDGLRIMFGKRIHKLPNRKGVFIVSDLQEHPLPCRLLSV